MPKAVVHVTEDLLSDLESVYKTIGEAGDEVRDGLLEIAHRMKHSQLTASLMKPHGVFGTTFSFDLPHGLSCTYRIETYRDEQKQPIEEHYWLKNLLRKK